VNSNRGIRNITLFVGLCAVALACSLGAQAQTYRPNYIYTIAGGGPVLADPSKLDLPGPTTAVKDAAGNVYFSAPDTGYVYVLDPTLTTLKVFAGKGYGGYGGDGGIPTKALLGGVTGLAFDSKGNIYFADALGSRIRVVNMGTTNITIAGVVIKPGNIATVAGNGTKCDKAGLCGDGGKAGNANLNLPESVALDSLGNIYIADMTDNRIRVVNVGTSSMTIAGIAIPPGDINTVAGNSQACTNSQGTPPTCGDGGAAHLAQLTMPYGVAVDSTGNIYIADTRDQEIRAVNPGTTPRTILGVTVNGGTIATVAGNGFSCFNQSHGCGDGGAPTSALLWAPKGVFTDAAGDLYIADTNAGRIRYIANVSSPVITTVVDSKGVTGFSGDGGPATLAQTNGPSSIFADASGTLLIPDTGNQRIREVVSGTINTIAGGSMGGDGGSPTAATLANPWDVAEDGNGNIFIVDQGNNRIREIVKATGLIQTVAGNGFAGSSGDGGPAIAAELNGPSGIALDSSGNLYITDSNNLVVRAVNMGTTNLTLGTVTISPGDIATVLGQIGVSCNPTTASCGDDGPALGATFAFPLFIALDSSNNVFVSDYQASRIRQWKVSTNFVTNPVGTGVQGYSAPGTQGNKAKINHPAGIGLFNGVLYFADQWDDIAQEVNLSTDILSIYALNTLAKFAGDGGPCPKASMFNPLAFNISPVGDGYISGGNDNLVQRCSWATGIFSTVAGAPTRSYQAAFSGDGGPAINARMANLGSFVDGNSNLYIADGGNNRIRYVPLAADVTLSTPQLSLGQWPIGVAGNPIPLTLTGAGGLDLTAPVISFTGPNAADFAVPSGDNGCTGLLSPEVNCTISVVMTPSQYGQETATMVLTDNGVSSPQQVSLSGFGPDFTIGDSPSSQTVAAGSAATFTVTLTPQAKFAQLIGLTDANCPTNATCSFNPTSVQLYGASAQTSTFTVQTASNTPKGTYTVTTTGTFSPLVHSTTVTVIVQ
jgi:trimeric autotransporter adhesin